MKPKKLKYPTCELCNKNKSIERIYTDVGHGSKIQLFLCYDCLCSDYSKQARDNIFQGAVRSNMAAIEMT